MKRTPKDVIILKLLNLYGILLFFFSCGKLFFVYQMLRWSILYFFKYFTLYLGKAFQCQPVMDIASGIPLSFQKVRSILRVTDNFVEYVVCPQCHSIYEYKDCIVRTGDGSQESKRCQHVSFPNHPHQSRRKQCGALLLKKVRRDKKYHLVPIRIFPYYPIQKSIERLARSEGFLEMCESWRGRKTFIPDSYLGDIYDGNVWRDFDSVDKYNFLTSPYCYLTTLNVDWFQPFSHSLYSVGAIIPNNSKFAL